MVCYKIKKWLYIIRFDYRTISVSPLVMITRNTSRNTNIANIISVRLKCVSVLCVSFIYLNFGSVFSSFFFELRTSLLQRIHRYKTKFKYLIICVH